MTDKEKAREYSFNVQSELFNKLPKELQELWKKETEQHFLDGMKTTEEISTEQYNKMVDECIYGDIPVSEDLEEAAMKYDRVIKVINKHSKIVDTSGREYFILGSQWKEQQMMKDAVDGKILTNYDGNILSYDECSEVLNKFEAGDKVKLIIIKED